jgi:HPt (histidine-containing phosphotransfer) domain-containing protein
MLDLLRRGDFHRIELLAHSMKGTGGGYGFDAITALGASLETAARQGAHEEVERDLASLRSYLSRVEVQYA